MTIRVGGPGRLTAIAWALAGVLGGHQLTYAILFPNGHQHAEALAESGHGWLGLLGPALVIALLVAVASGLLGGMVQRGARQPVRRGVRFAVLAAIQIGCFVAIEVGERVGAGMTLHTVSHELFVHGFAAILVLGCLIQLFTAWLGSAASRIIASVAARFRSASPRRSRAIPIAPLPPARPPIGRPVRAHASRGPPLLVVCPSAS